jgi:hypothetical protein
VLHFRVQLKQEESAVSAPFLGGADRRETAVCAPIRGFSVGARRVQCGAPFQGFSGSKNESVSSVNSSWSRAESALCAPFQGYRIAGAESRMCCVLHFKVTGLLEQRAECALCAPFRVTGLLEQRAECAVCSISRLQDSWSREQNVHCVLHFGVTG